MKIRFTTDRTLHDGTKFVKGQVYDLNEASGNRWIRRGVAVVVPDGSELEVAAVASPENAKRPRGRPRKVVEDAPDVESNGRSDD